MQIAKALYSGSGELIGKRIAARADAHAVKLYWRGELIKVHPVMAPERRHTDPADLPAEVSVYAMRDLNALQRKAAHGTHVGTYATAVLEHSLPWTKMRQVYRLLVLVRRHAPEAVRDPCRRALDAEVVDVGLIERILTRGGGEQLPDAQALISSVSVRAGEFRLLRPAALVSPQRPDTTPAVKPIVVSAELKALMRRLKLGQLLDNLPDRLALARTNRLPHHDFLELLFADEATRRDRASVTRRAKAAHLDPQMHLQAWDCSTAVTFDEQLWAELTSLRFLADVRFV